MHDELTAILLRHAEKYPKIEPQDAVKLLYQSAFGPGHLIADKALARARLEAELSATPSDAELPLLEPIGGGYARLHLAAAKAQGLPEEEIADRFFAAAEAETPGKAAFEAALSVLERLAREEKCPFSAAALADYLADYRAAGCPMVSHSETYRTLYRPAYRVVRL